MRGDKRAGRCDAVAPDFAIIAYHGAKFHHTGFNLFISVLNDDFIDRSTIYLFARSKLQVGKLSSGAQVYIITQD